MSFNPPPPGQFGKKAQDGIFQYTDPAWLSLTNERKFVD